ncbi:MAG: rhomboid family intramembrane serine protease [Ignavibacteriaceae bacterium]|nr:rhomboid family intramembrane serine protease [Ignavibacteriaceae bacterium]
MDNYYKPSGFGGFSFFPPVIKNLLIINGVVFIITLLMEQLIFNGMPGTYIVNKWLALNPIGEGYNFQVWQLVTYQFIHANFTHILFNMFGLWMFGMEIENIWGSRKFLYFYLLCGVVAGLFNLFLTPLLGAPPAVTVGASGAIYGVLVAFGLFFPNRYIFLYFFIPVKAKYLIGFFVILEFFMVNSGGNVAHLAHLGGAITGLIYILLDSKSDIALKGMFRRNAFRQNTQINPFGKMPNPFKKKPDVDEADYYDLENGTKNITQAEIDEILDKISRSGYQNLTDHEKKILFEASKKMK